MFLHKVKAVFGCLSPCILGVDAFSRFHSMLLNLQNKTSVIRQYTKRACKIMILLKKAVHRKFLSFYRPQNIRVVLLLAILQKFKHLHFMQYQNQT